MALCKQNAFHAYGVMCRHFAGGPDPVTPLTYPEVYAAGEALSCSTALRCLQLIFHSTCKQ